MTELSLPRVLGADPAAAARAQAELDRKTKPQGSLGRLEELAVRLAGARGDRGLGALDAAAVVAAADHGYAVHGVSAFPQKVTAQMLGNFAAGGAGVAVMARHAGARLVVVDVGTAQAPAVPSVRSVRIAAGTRDATRGAAMSMSEVNAAITAGLDLAAELAGTGVDLVAAGEMGIANTTAASAVTAGLLSVEPEVVCGRGTGIDDKARARKVAVVERALAVNGIDARRPLAVLAAVGGLEIAFLVGLMVGGAAERMVVVLDGFVVGAAALVAQRLKPRVVDHLVASHLSPEPGHRLILESLELVPLLEWQLRLGEASGAVLVLPLLRQAVRVLVEMATFEGAGVSREHG
jgi:nicotinate-nucleotide--dimethylbenzimidazole phosphoribosyltransferase